MEMAAEWKVADNQLFQAAANQYALQLDVIDQLKKAIKEADGMICEKTYVRDRANIAIHPAVKELPHHADIANKSASVLLKIIQELGTRPVKQESKLAAFEHDE